MAITKITRTIRPNTSVQFYRDAGIANKGNGQFPEFDKMNAILTDMLDAGKMTREFAYSDDQLVETRTFTFVDLDALGEAETAITPAAGLEFQTYRITNNFTIQRHTEISERVHAYEYKNINQPYRLTTTYTFPAGESYIDTFIASLEHYEHYGKLQDLYLNGNDVVLIHQYANSDDQTNNPYLDMFYVPQLVEKNVTRKIQYAYV